MRTLKVSQSRKQIMVSSIIPKNEQKINIQSISLKEDAYNSDL